MTVAPYQRRKFPAHYTEADIRLLAYVDQAHGTLSGPATRRILQREYHEHHIEAYQRLAQISSAQIYRFRKTAEYRKRHTSYQPTRPTPIPIEGNRRARTPRSRRRTRRRRRRRNPRSRSLGFLLEHDSHCRVFTAPILVRALDYRVVSQILACAIEVTPQDEVGVLL